MPDKEETPETKTAICQSNFSAGLDPVIFKERKERWWEVTALMREQKLFIINKFSRYEFTTCKDGPNTMRMILTKEAQEMVDYLDMRIDEAAKNIIGQGV